MFEKSKSRSMVDLSNDRLQKRIRSYISHSLVSSLASAKRLTWRLNPLFQHFIETICLTALESLVFLSSSHISVFKSCEAPSERLSKQLPSRMDMVRYRLFTSSCSSVELLQSCGALNRRGFYAFLLPQNARDHTTFTSAERSFAFFLPIAHLGF